MVFVQFQNSFLLINTISIELGSQLNQQNPLLYNVKRMIHRIRVADKTQYN